MHVRLVRGSAFAAGFDLVTSPCANREAAAGLNSCDSGRCADAPSLYFTDHARACETLPAMR